MYPITKNILIKLITNPEPVLDINSNSRVAFNNPLRFQQLFGNTIINQVCNALFLLLFLSFLRIGNVIPRIPSQFDNKRQLNLAESQMLSSSRCNIEDNICQEYPGFQPNIRSAIGSSTKLAVLSCVYTEETKNNSWISCRPSQCCVQHS